MKKKIAVALCTGLATMSLVACGGKDTTQAVDTLADTATDTETQTTEEETKDDTFGGNDSASDTDFTVETSIESEQVDETFGGNASEEDTEFTVESEASDSENSVTSADALKYLNEDLYLGYNPEAEAPLFENNSDEYSGLFAFPVVKETDYIKSAEIDAISNYFEYILYKGPYEDTTGTIGFQLGLNDYAHYSSDSFETDGDDDLYLEPEYYCSVDIDGESVDVYAQKTAIDSYGTTIYFYPLGGFSVSIEVDYGKDGNPLTEEDVRGMIDSISLVK
jgi:hypothetical protein